MKKNDNLILNILIIMKHYQILIEIQYTNNETVS